METIQLNALIAQLDRAFDYGSKGYRFESYRSHIVLQEAGLFCFIYLRRMS